MLTLKEARNQWVQETVVDGVRSETIAGVAVSEAASIVPWMTEEEFRELLESMREKGYNAKYPVLNDFMGRIVDGRHRFLASVVLEIEPEWATAEEDDHAEVIIANLRRRNLTPSVRASTYLRLVNKDAGEVTEASDEEQEQKSQLDRAASAGVSRRTMQHAEAVEKSENTTEELRAAVTAGVIAVDKADALKELPPEKQREIVSQPDRTSVRKAASSAAREVTTTRAERTFDLHKWKPAFNEKVSKMLAAVPEESRDVCKRHMQETLGSTVSLERDTEMMLNEESIVGYMEEIIAGLPKSERAGCEAAIGKRYAVQVKDADTAIESIHGIIAGLSDAQRKKVEGSLRKEFSGPKAEVAKSGKKRGASAETVAAAN